MQAVILAAGIGSRMGNLTKDRPKTMVPVNGKPILDYIIDSLIKNDVHKIHIVTGYKNEIIVSHISETYGKTPLEFNFIHNDRYSTTNNIVSVQMCLDKMSEDDTILIESDLIFDSKLIKSIIDSDHDNIAVVSKYETWMNGTGMKLDEDSFVTEVIRGKDVTSLDKLYKTVNIYKFSPSFIKNRYFDALKKHLKEHGVNEYYEVPLQYIVKNTEKILYALDVEDHLWYEVDDENDLKTASSMFS